MKFKRSTNFVKVFIYVGRIMVSSSIIVPILTEFLKCIIFYSVTKIMTKYTAVGNIQKTFFFFFLGNKKNRENAFSNQS